jgi:glycosyltransferase involved in cell wall biosynthesis
MGISPSSNLGGTVHDREILKSLAKLGVEVFIPLPKGELYDDITGWHIFQTPRHIKYYYEYNILFVPSIYALVREKKFNILRIHSPTIAPLGFIFKKIFNLPLVGHYHHLEDDRIKTIINQYCIRDYDLITTDSNFSARQIVKKFAVQTDKIAVIGNGVDDKYRPLAKDNELLRQLGLDKKNQVIILYLGVLEPRKNIHFLLDVFSMVLKEKPDLKLIIAGTGSSFRKLKQYADSLHLSQSVLFTGYIAESEKIKYYNLADIFVFPSKLEGFGLSLAEAMACGVPVIASSSSSIPEVVGDSGILIDGYKKEKYCQEIVHLVEDIDLRNELSEKGRKRILQSFSWKKAGALSKEAFQNILGTKKPS